MLPKLSLFTSIVAVNGEFRGYSWFRQQYAPPIDPAPFFTESVLRPQNGNNSC